MQISTITSFNLFVSAVAIMSVIWVFAQILAHLADALLWWALPTAVKVWVRKLQLELELINVRYAEWEYKNFTRFASFAPCWLTNQWVFEAEQTVRERLDIAFDLEQDIFYPAQMNEF